jgi:hypothetical protein
MKPATRQLLLRHFHTTRRDDLRHILTGYMRIAKAIEEGIRFEGEKQCQTSPTGRVCGYANMTQLFGGFGRVHICFDPRPGHCDFTSFPPDQQEAIVIHEVAHRYVGIDDKAYRHEANYATLTPQQALNNADSYAFFAVEGFTTLSEAPEHEAIASFDAVNEDFEDREAKDVIQFDALASFEEADASEAEEALAPSYDSQADPLIEALEAEELEAGFNRCTADEGFAEEQEEELSESAAWTGTAVQIAFRDGVLAEHIRRSTGKKRRPLRDLRDDELEKIPGTNIKTKVETARAAGRLLAAARADLAKDRAAGDTDALRTKDVSVGSGYRGSSDQRQKWLSYFRRYYDQTRAARERLPGGPHSDAAVDYMLAPEGPRGFGLTARIAAPGFSNHQNGIAIDFTQQRTSQEVGISTSKENRSRWRQTWFYSWLKRKRKAACYGFVPYKKEEWHWEYKPKEALSSEAELEAEAADRAARVPVKEFLGGSIWTYSSLACATRVAVFVPPAASGGKKVDAMLYVHGLLSPCGAPKVMPEGIISDAPFRLGQLIVDSGLPMVIVVPCFQPGNDKTWSAHGLDRPGTLNALFEEILAEMGRHLGRPILQIGQLVIAGHSRAFGVLYPLARSHPSPALAMGALSRLSKVWVLDATYGTPPMAAFEALAATKSGLGIDIIYRAPSPTNKFGGRSRPGPVALRPINSRSISLCAVPSKMLPTLMAELAAQSSAETEVLSGADLQASPYWESEPSDREDSEQQEMTLDERQYLEAGTSNLDYEDEEKTLESLPDEVAPAIFESAAEFDPYAGIRPALSPEHAALTADEIAAVLGPRPTIIALHGLLSHPDLPRAALAILLGNTGRRSVFVNGADIPIAAYLRQLSRLCREAADYHEAELGAEVGAAPLVSWGLLDARPAERDFVMRERTGLESELGVLGLHEAGPASLLKPVVQLDSFEFGDEQAAFEAGPAGQPHAAACKAFPTPSLLFEVKGRVVVNDAGAIRPLRKGDAGSFPRLAAVVETVPIGGVSAGVGGVARVRDDGGFTVSATAVLAKGVWRLRLRVLVSWRGGKTFVDATATSSDLVCFLRLVDQHENARDPKQTRFEFLSSVRKMYQPSPDSSLASLFPRVLDRTAKVQPLFGTSSFWRGQYSNYNNLTIRGEAVDIGHVLVGIEAHRRQGARAQGMPVPWSPDKIEALMTWAGDLGGVLAYVAYETPRLTGSKTIDLLRILRGKASFTDLRGDLDGINLGAIYNDQLSTAQNLKAYYEVPSFRRYRNFIANALHENGAPLFRLTAGKPPKVDPVGRPVVADYLDFVVRGYVLWKDSLANEQAKLTNAQAQQAHAIGAPGSKESNTVVDYFFEFLNKGLASEL